MAANAIAPPYRLAVGQTLRLPRSKRHVVVAGDTVSGLARAYGVSPRRLVAANRLVPPYTIHIGRELILPSTIPRHAARRPTPGVRVIAGAPPPIPTARPRREAPRARPAPKRPRERAGSRFAWPVRGRVISRYGPKPGGLYNDGINIAAGHGTAVRAAENGVVAYVGNELGGFGNLLLVRHAGGWMTAYAHNSEIVVKPEDRVRRGQVIARVGRTGNVGTAQLHFELRRGKAAVDPLKYMARRAEAGVRFRAAPRDGPRGPG